ncbi:hypothetical protein AB0O84_28395, partial [Streptomyces sp. NPDC088752]
SALQATDRIPFGVVNAPGQRYHPAIVAQAVGRGPARTRGPHPGRTAGTATRARGAPESPGAPAGVSPRTAPRAFP